MLSLKRVDRSNYLDCIGLSVGPTQRGNILPNIDSLAELAVTPEATALAIYAGEVMIGFAMYQKDEDGVYDIHRFMIDFRYQRKGLGLEAIKLILSHISSLPDVGDRIKIMFLIENSAAEKIYLKAGFVDSGKLLFNEQWNFTEKVFYYHLN